MNNKKPKPSKVSTKRTRKERDLVKLPKNNKGVTQEFLTKCQREFRTDPANAMARNAVATAGILACTDSDRVNEISHVFIASVKSKHTRATSQAHSGRCWMFSALNTFRHCLIKAMDLENFEFSETYLFFWDKFERANAFLQWFCELTPEDIKDTSDGNIKNIKGRETEFMINSFMTDGGWWSTFVNLVEKYGLVPKDAMQETAGTMFSSDMNQVIEERLKAGASALMQLCVSDTHKKTKKDTQKAAQKDAQKRYIKETVLQQVYDTLVKFMGEPPAKFNWVFRDNNYDPSQLSSTPLEFANIVMPPEVIAVDDYVVLTNIPPVNIPGMENVKYYEKYEIRLTSNIANGRNVTFLNLPIAELKNAARDSILGGHAVWFGADVNQRFHPWHAALDDKLVDTDLTFGKPFHSEEFEKGRRLLFRTTTPNHAMALTGVNFTENSTTNWQVENSWGYFDNETPGLDGFLWMSDSWFDNYVVEITIHKHFLPSRRVSRALAKPARLVDPWGCLAKSLCI